MSQEETEVGACGACDELVIPFTFSVKYDLSYIRTCYSSLQMTDDEVQHK
jgi:hypothetical protein